MQKCKYIKSYLIFSNKSDSFRSKSLKGKKSVWNSKTKLEKRKKSSYSYKGREQEKSTIVNNFSNEIYYNKYIGIKVNKNCNKTNPPNNNIRVISENNISKLEKKSFIQKKILKVRNISKLNDQAFNTNYEKGKGNNININNNIIININNQQYESISTKVNKSKNAYKKKSPNKQNSRKLSKGKTSNKSNNKKKINLNLSNNNYTEEYGCKNYVNIDKLKGIRDRQIPIDYLNIIYTNLLIEETKGILPKPIYNYLNAQDDINEQMRSILIDWIIDIHYKYGFKDETLFMTVNIIDRYSTIKQISRTKYQLLGITAMMISCKHEEIEFPKINDFIYITGNLYTKDEMIKMEYDILKVLNFNLLFPSSNSFFEFLALNFNFSKKFFFMGKYLMESFLIDIKYIKYKASVIASACAYIVMKFYKMDLYQESYDKKYYILNDNEELPLGHGVKDCAQDICFLIDNIKSSNYLATFKKYSKNDFESVALIIENK